MGKHEDRHYSPTLRVLFFCYRTKYFEIQQAYIGIFDFDPTHKPTHMQNQKSRSFQYAPKTEFNIENKIYFAYFNRLKIEII